MPQPLSLSTSRTFANRYATYSPVSAVCSIGLKTVVLEMPASMAASAIRQLTPQLIRGVQREALEVKLECLEVLNDLLRRFAANLGEADSRECLAALFDELTSVRAAARKRAIACIASLSASLPDRMLEGQLVGAIFAQVTATLLSPLRALSPLSRPIILAPLHR